MEAISLQRLESLSALGVELALSVWHFELPLISVDDLGVYQLSPASQVEAGGQISYSSISFSEVLAL